MQQALSGVKVLDLTMNLPGPFMTWLLAELGADVLKVENPQGGDYARALSTGEGKGSPVFEAVNRKKKSLALNLKASEGHDLFLRLLDQYDVLIEGFRPGVMDSLGLGYDTLKEKYPNLIYVSISGYGQDGPYRLRGGHDLNYLSLAGIIGMTGTCDGDLAIPGIQIADLAGGALMSLAGFLAALYQREKTGKGQFVDVAMFDGSFALATVAYSTMVAGMDKPAPGNMFLTGAYPFYNVYRTKDGKFMSLGAVEFKFWQNFCLASGREDLVAQQFGGPDIKQQIADIFASKTQDEWVEFLKDVDCCCEAVLPLDQAAESPLAKARNMVEKGVDGTPFLAPPLKLSGSERGPDSPAPQLGAHNKEVLSALGLSDADMDALAQKGVI
jgi:alpha-methylacyl-CoA racemase